MRTKLFLPFCVLIVTLFSIESCKKELSNFQLQNSSIPDQDAINNFLTLPDSSGTELKKIVEDLKKEEQLHPFLGDFIRANGSPLWQYTIANKSLFIKRDLNDMLKKVTTETFNTTEAAVPVYFIPLIDSNTKKLTAFIYCAKTGDSLFKYEVYNKVEVEKNRPKSLKSFNNAALVMGIFSAFENSINNKKNPSMNSHIIYHTKTLNWFLILKT